MQIVSYRGPAQAGGVSTLIKAALHSNPESTWWHLDNQCLRTITRGKLSHESLIASHITDGHYKYCNEFLWPQIHGRSDLASYDDSQHTSYRAFNMAIAAQLNRYGGSQQTFIHDYQFALVPYYFSEWKSSQTVFFWHIPWPAFCDPATESHMIEIARGLLRCRIVGFHIHEYAKNFCAFIREFLPEFRVLSNERSVVHSCGRMTTIIASPAGIDSAHWRKAARAATSARPVALPYILSVDRADYTKGILERIRAIRDLFRLQPELRRNLQFVFACQQTRKGLPAYDEYWRNCRSNFQDVILELATDDWAPIVWLTDAMTPDKLATWYAHAAAMLVNPSVDGLNLTAKEFVASSVNPESILILSKGAGVWYELRENIVTINDCQPDEITEAILRARQQSSACSRANLLALKQTVRANSLQRWWQNLVDYRNLDLSNISVRDSA